MIAYCNYDNHLPLNMFFQGIPQCPNTKFTPNETSVTNIPCFKYLNFRS